MGVGVQNAMATTFNVLKNKQFKCTAMHQLIGRFLYTSSKVIRESQRVLWQIDILSLRFKVNISNTSATNTHVQK